MHTDLKPENILLLDSSYDREPIQPGSNLMTRVPHSGAIRLIDFGSATWEHQYHSSVVSTRHYRVRERAARRQLPSVPRSRAVQAPEVILGMSWSYPCDVWSLGCILIELLTGDALFQTHKNLEHLAMMEVVLGPIPASVIQRSDVHSKKYFRHASELRWPEGSSSRDSVRTVRKMCSLGELVASRVPGPRGTAFTDLLMRLLRYEPQHRLTPSQALRHSFFAEGGGGRAEPARTASRGGADRLLPRGCGAPEHMGGHDKARTHKIR